MSFLRKTGRFYTVLAVILLNTVVFLVVLNLTIYLVWKVKRAYFDLNPVYADYGKLQVRKAYPNLSAGEVDALLAEIWSRPLIFDTFTHFRERPYRGKYVNVHEAGFRWSKDQGPWPPDPANCNVFVFGGSTTFGYGLPDDQTVASYLQQFLNAGTSATTVRICNFAQGAYYSIQERILFEKLLAAGHVPDMAIFVDGLNDLYHCVDNTPLHIERLQGQIEGGTGHYLLLALGDSYLAKAAVKLSNAVGRRFRGSQTEASEKKSAERQEGRDQAMITAAIKRYVENKKMIEAIAEAYHIRVAFVWQPVSYYKYDLKHHPFKRSEYWKRVQTGAYEAMARFVEQNPLGNSFLWCADIGEGETRMLYVDGFHYSAVMAEKLACAIQTLLVERKLFPIPK